MQQKKAMGANRNPEMKQSVIGVKGVRRGGWTMVSRVDAYKLFSEVRTEERVFKIVGVGGEQEQGAF